MTAHLSGLTGVDAARLEEAETLRVALSALSKMTLGEYPDGYTLAQVVAEWGPDFGLSQPEIDAVVAASRHLTC